MSERRGQVAEVTEAKPGRLGVRYSTRTYYWLRFPDADGGWYSDNEVDLLPDSSRPPEETGQ